MRDVHVLASDRFSGAENVVCQIIGMTRDDPEMEMVYCSKDGQIRDALKEQGIVFAPLNAIKMSEMKAVIKKYAPDVIHAHDMRASLIAALSCGNIPLISHIHNNAYNSRGLSIKSVAYLFAAVKAKKIFWVSDSSYKGYFFHGLLKNKSSVLYNVINREELYAKMEKDRTEYRYDAVYVGRLTYQKNPQRLVKIFSKVVELSPSATIAVVGSGDLEAETMHLCEENGLASNMHFLGFRSNPLKILKDSKLLVMTSRWEGTPIVALEAMAFGKPIVSTPVDGLRVLIENDKTGYMSEEDNILAQKIVEIITDTEYQKALSCGASKRFNEYNSIDKYRETIIESYKEIV